MKKHLIFALCTCFAITALAQQQISLGGGSYAEYPPEAVAYEDGYFAHPAKWFELAWDDINLHENARNKPVPTNDWWTDFLFRGLGRTQPTIHEAPVTVTTTGDRFGTAAWAYPHMVKASAAGFDVVYPKGFGGGTNGAMVEGAALKINATSQLQSESENILFADFEVTTWAELGAGWTVVTNSGNSAGPANKNSHNQSPTPSGYSGDRYVNSYAGVGDGATFTLHSPTFTVTKKYIKLSVGGGNYPTTHYVGLFINDVKVLNETGSQSATLTQRTWDVSEYIGQTAQIRIVDGGGGGYGFIMCDDIIFTDSQLGGAGYTADFQTTAAKVYDWSDLGFTLRSEQAGGKYMDATIIHGVPFTYFEMDGLYPLVAPGSTATVYNKSGQQVTTFPAAMDAFTVEYSDRVFGVHAPAGSTIHRSRGGDFQIETPASKRFVVISVLPDRTFLSQYDQYARNKPGDIQFVPEYKVEQGKVVTTFNMNTRNLDTNTTGGQTLMAFMPHHWRNTTKNFSFISGADYLIFKGLMHTAAGTSFEIQYPFGGMPPYMPEPLGLTSEKQSTLENLVSRYVSGAGGWDGNTYAKGLGEKTTGMLMAKALELPEFEQIKNTMKTQLADWLSFSETEKNAKGRYFALYPNYGALIGFPPGYGSQGFNDLHFHNGYFTVGAARLMMVDEQFKKDYGEMVKLVTKTFANWDRVTGPDNNTGNWQPYLRTFDPYLGHSFAGGTGDGGGNNQESTSEAINSWFGVYMLGVVLNDKNIIDVGATGYLLENLATAEYWLDVYEENFPSNYPYEYVGILRTDNLARATYFHGDPAWALGIQACPLDFFYRGYMVDPAATERIQNAMWADRLAADVNLGENGVDGTDPYGNIKLLGGYLGGYHMNILQYANPETAADFWEALMKESTNNWQSDFDLQNKSAGYFISNSMVTYGSPAEGYHTSIPSGAVYKNADGTLSYLLYNATDEAKDVKIYKDGAVVETITVGPGKYYNSRVLNSPPTVKFTSVGDKLVQDRKTTLTVAASDKDGRVVKVDFYFDGALVGSSYSAPFELTFTPAGAVGATKELKAVAFDDDNLESEPAIATVTMIGEPVPFGRTTPWNVPADRIYASQFDDGGPEISSHANSLTSQGGDNCRLGTGIETEGMGAGCNNYANSNIGWLQANEWYEYTINVAKTAMYDMYVASQGAGGGSGGVMRVFVDGVDENGEVTVVAASGYPDRLTTQVMLEQGKHVVRILIVQNGWNFRSFRFAESADPIPSKVDAGEDQVIIYPDNTTATLTATPKTYGTATITKYEWKQTDSNAPVTIATPNQATTVVSGLVLGTYTFEVTITDSNGATATDQVVVSVRPGNYPPVARPGSFREIEFGEELKLDGSLSSDSDGTIVKYEWKQVDENDPVQISQASETNPEAIVTGYQANKLYTFQLTVTDDKGATGSDNVSIMINTTGINETSGKEVFVYPNPFADQIIITNTGTKNLVSVKLYAVTGDLLMEKDMQGLKVAYLDTTGLKGGYYLLTIHSDDDVISYKMIKK